MRRAWRMLATLCADADYPTLRFDYPGCGDSTGDLESVSGVEALAEAAATAAGELKRRSEIERLVVIGHGLGAAVAALTAPRVGAEALALFAPPTSGRTHLRELDLWGRRVAEGLGFAPGAPEAEATGGFRLPAALRESLERLDLRAWPFAPAPAVFLAARPTSVADTEFAEHLRAHGAAVTAFTYGEYAAALEAPTTARPPIALFEAFTAWLSRTAPARLRPAAAAAQPRAAQLCGPGFRETLVRFGPRGRLAGAACTPAEARTGASVLFLNAGGDAHTGWARSTVQQARGLATQGVASFRIDLGDIGDSSGPPSPAPPRVFDPLHVEDVLTAVDWLETNGLGPVMPVGRCSGASVGFSAAVRDPRLRDLVLINPPQLAADLAAAAERPASRLAYYLDRGSEPLALLRRWRRGELDLQAALGKLFAAAAGLGLAGLSGDREAHALQRALQELGARGGRVTLLYTEADPGRAFALAPSGKDDRWLLGRDGVEVRFLDQADGALTGMAARAALLDLLARRAVEAGAGATPARRMLRRERDLPPAHAAPRPRPSA